MVQPKKYADMLKEELACDVFEIGNFPFHQAEHYDFIIAAGGIYAGGISVMKDIRRNQRFLSDKNCGYLCRRRKSFLSQNI